MDLLSCILWQKQDFEQPRQLYGPKMFGHLRRVRRRTKNVLHFPRLPIAVPSKDDRIADENSWKRFRPSK
jgi:hypothetical protein